MGLKKGCCSPKSNSTFREPLGFNYWIGKEMFLKALTGLAVLSGEQVVGQWGGVGQALQDSIEEARVAHV